MTRRWHFWLLVILTIAALVIVFWPLPVTEDDVQPGNATGARTDTELLPGPAASVANADTDYRASDTSSAGALLNQQAVNAWHAGEIQDAMALFEQAIDAAPDDPAPHSSYGRLLTLMVSYQRALPLLERANELRPDDAQTWLDLATLYERAELLDKSWSARAEAERLVGADAITRDEQGRFIVQGTTLW